MRARVSSAQWLQERARTHAPCRTRTCSDLSRQRHGSASSAYAHACARATHLDAHSVALHSLRTSAYTHPANASPAATRSGTCTCSAAGLPLNSSAMNMSQPFRSTARLAPLVPPTSGRAVLAHEHARARVHAGRPPRGTRGTAAFPPSPTPRRNFRRLGLGFDKNS